MNFLLEFIYSNKSIFTIITLIVVYGVVYYIFLKKHIIRYISDNWNYFKDKPYILPFTGIIRSNVHNKTNLKSSLSRTIHNINLFFTKIFKSFISLFTKPFYSFFQLITKVVKMIKDSLDKFRNMAAVIRKLFKQTVESTAKRISNSYAAVIYFQEKFKLILRKQSAMFSVFRQYATSMKFLMYSFSNGPIPKLIHFLMYYATLMIVMLVICVLCIFDIPFVSWVACPICAICFDEHTPIMLNDNNFEKINNLKIGQEINYGGKINGIIKVLAQRTQMYLYNNTKVSGSHLVFESNNWIRVENSKKAKLINYDSNKKLYCLITENNIITTKNTKFSDYQETQNPLINLGIQRIISKHLNRGHCVKSPNDIQHQYYWGFSKDTMICGKKISKISIGDIIDNNKIVGIVELSGSSILWYSYNNIIVSGSQLVNENGLWIRVHQSAYSKKINYISDKMYHLIVENNKLLINNIEFTDFCETCNEDVNDEIDELVLKHKNKHL